MPPVIDEMLCNVCLACWDGCPQDVFAQRGDLPPEVRHPIECWHCGACALDCPTEAIHLELPLIMQIVPSPALYGPPGPGEEEMVRRAAAFTRSVVLPRGEQ